MLWIFVDVIIYINMYYIYFYIILLLLYFRLGTLCSEYSSHCGVGYSTYEILFLVWSKAVVLGWYYFIPASWTFSLCLIFIHAYWKFLMSIYYFDLLIVQYCCSYFLAAVGLAASSNVGTFVFIINFIQLLVAALINFMFWDELTVI